VSLLYGNLVAVQEKEIFQRLAVPSVLKVIYSRLFAIPQVPRWYGTEVDRKDHSTSVYGLPEIIESGSSSVDSVSDTVPDATVGV
jgi:hypothetical protein